MDPHALTETLDPLGHGECLGHDAVARQLGARHHADRRAAAREIGGYFPIHVKYFCHLCPNTFLWNPMRTLSFMFGL